MADFIIRTVDNTIALSSVAYKRGMVVDILPDGSLNGSEQSFKTIAQGGHGKHVLVKVPGLTVDAAVTLGLLTEEKALPEFGNVRTARREFVVNIDAIPNIDRSRSVTLTEQEFMVLVGLRTK